MDTIALRTTPSICRLFAAALVAALALVLPPLSAPAGAQEASSEGRWEGAIQTPGESLRVVVDLATTEGEGWTGQIDIPAQGVADRELGGIEAGEDSVRFSIPGIPGSPTFRGMVTAAGDSLVGDFTQAGQAMPFRLARTGPAQISSAPAPGQLLEGFDAEVREAMEAFHVPGASVAIVHGGEVVLARGYGVRDRASGAAVTDSTVFPIGSMTKSFTSLLVADLVEEGRLAWGDPVHDRLPEFRLERDYPTLHTTPVDLLSHRTGLPRHDALWIAWEEADTVVTRSDFVDDLRHLEPTEEFRTAWQYNNFGYLTAGLLVGRVTGSTWEEQLRRRLLEPLGMRRSNVSPDSTLALSDHAAGYRVVRPDSGEVRVEPMDYFRIDAMAPAGAINSTATEMTRWLELHLNGGEVDGKRVVPAAAVERTHRREMPLEGGISPVEGDAVSHASYALGWQVQDYRGRRMLQHGGGIDGFTSLMAVLPEDELGVVVLSNRLGSAFTRAVTLTAVDRMLDREGRDWTGRFRKQAEQSRQSSGSGGSDTASAGAPPSHPRADYAGAYRHPAYGVMRVSSAGDSLVARLGTMCIDLDHQHYDLFTGRAANPLLRELSFDIQFETDRSGNVAALTVPLEPAAGPLRFERGPPERLRDPGFLNGLTGVYQVAGMEIEVRLRGERRLVFEQPGATAELVPRRGTRFAVEGQEGTTVEFLVEDGRATGIVIHQVGRRFEGEKVSSGG